MAIERVKQRVIEGGHSIPTDVIIRRYHSGIDNFFKIYMNIVDSWMLVENQSNPRIIIAEQSSGDVIIHNKELFERVRSYVK